MFDIITFGSATRDVFLRTKGAKIINNKEFASNKGLCFGLGSKIEIKELHLSSGGGGTNSAATFAKQGFKVAYCGQVGNDLAGQEIIEELKNIGVETRLTTKTSQKTTNHSIVLSLPGKDRTVLVYRGASEVLEEKDIPWQELEAEWFYLAPLSGNLIGLFEKIVDWAKTRKIKVAANLGNSQISLPAEKSNQIIKKIDILILNQEEASLLTKIPYQKEKEIFKKLDQLCPGIAIMTKGQKGATVSDGKSLYQAGSFKTTGAEKTGAGDAFGSGFLAGFLQKKDIPFAIQLATANATSCIKKIGAKNGLLAKNEEFPKIKVSKISL